MVLAARFGPAFVDNAVIQFHEENSECGDPALLRRKVAAIITDPTIDQPGDIGMKIFKRAGVTVAWLLVTSSALAGGDDQLGEPFQPVDAQAMIDACWAMTYEQRLGSTADTREGIFASVICLEEHILAQFAALFPPTTLSRQTAAHKLETIREAYTDLYWHIYNENKGCGFCPTQYYSSDLSAWARVLERMLRDAVEQRNRYKL